jgi:cysteine synthase
MGAYRWARWRRLGVVTHLSGPSSLIVGVGRPRCEPSFIPELIDRASAVSDVESIAAARVLSRRIGRSSGGSTGTNLWAAAKIIAGTEASGVGCSPRGAPRCFSRGWLANTLATKLTVIGV